MENNVKNLNTELADDQLDQVTGGAETVVFAQPMEFRTCPYCGHQYPGIYDTCPACHFQKTCPKCKTAYPAQLLYCTNCSAAFHEYYNDSEGGKLRG